MWRRRAIALFGRGAPIMPRASRTSAIACLWIRSPFSAGNFVSEAARLLLLALGVGRGLHGFGGLRVFAGEALDAARGVQQLLRAGEKRMAARANFHAQQIALDRRARF